MNPHYDRGGTGGVEDAENTVSYSKTKNEYLDYDDLCMIMHFILLAQFARCRLICRNGREEIDSFVAFTFLLRKASANVRLYQYSSVSYDHNMIFIVALPIRRRRETFRRLSSQATKCNVYKVSLLFYFSSCNIVVHFDDPGPSSVFPNGSTPLPCSFEVTL